MQHSHNRFSTTNGTRAAISSMKAETSKIWLPMWACTPTSSRSVKPLSASTASAAAPDANEKPNFVSSCPVFTYSWVCASMPGVTRSKKVRATRREVGCHARRLRARNRLISSKESTTILATPARRAAVSSSEDLLLPWNTSCPPRAPPTSTDGHLPSGRDVERHVLLEDQCSHRLAQKSLGRVGDTAREAGDGLAAPFAHMVFVVDEDRCADLLRELQEVHAADAQVPVASDGGGVGEQVPEDRPFGWRSG